MKEVSKTKKGFTLIEMVLVMAIIAIIALVVFRNVTEYIDKAHEAKTNMVNYSVEVQNIVGTIIKG